MPPRTSTRKTASVPKVNGQTAPKTASSALKRDSVRVASGAKRKTREHDTANDEHEHEHTHVDDESAEEDEKPAKKRRTQAKGKGDGQTEMPSLAERTVVGPLKKAMYIGAHVSASGGWFPL